MRTRNKGLAAISIGLVLALGGVVTGFADHSENGVSTENVSYDQTRTLSNGWQVPKSWPSDTPLPNERVVVLDSNGKAIVCPGQKSPLTIRLDSAPPPSLGSEVLESASPNGGEIYRSTEDVVARCGPQGKPYWVPDRYADRTSAPAAYTSSAYEAR